MEEGAKYKNSSSLNDNSLEMNFDEHNAKPYHTKEQLEDPLTPADLEFFDKNGYVVLHDAVPPEMLRSCVNAIWTRVGANPNNKSTWYRPPATQIGFVGM